MVLYELFAVIINVSGPMYSTWGIWSSVPGAVGWEGQRDKAVLLCHYHSCSLSGTHQWPSKSISLYDHIATESIFQMLWSGHHVYSVLFFLLFLVMFSYSNGRWIIPLLLTEYLYGWTIISIKKLKNNQDVTVKSYCKLMKHWLN